MNGLRLSCLTFVLVSLFCLTPPTTQAQEWKNLSIPAGSLIGIAWNPLDTCEVVGFQYMPALACRSMDGGQTWTVGDNLPDPPYLNAQFFYHPTSADTQYFWGQERLEVSVDGGQTWESRRPPGAVPPLLQVDICNSQPNHMLVYASNRQSHSTTWLSDDAGETWQEMDNIVNAHYTQFDPFDPTHLFATGAHGLLHSTDSGTTFVPYLTNYEEMEEYEIRFYDLDPTCEGRLYISYGQMEQEHGDVFCLTSQTLAGEDYLFTAQELYVDAGGNLIAEYWQHMDEPHTVIVSSDGGESFTTPGFWMPYAGHDGTFGFHYLKVFINPLNPSTMLLSNYTNLFLSRDGGSSPAVLVSGITSTGVTAIYPHEQGPLVITSNEQLWQFPEHEVPPNPRSYEFIQDVALPDDHSLTMFAAGVGLHRSVDGGQNFSQMMMASYPESSPSVTYFPGEMDTLLAWHMDGLILSGDGGSNWNFIVSEGLFNPHHTDLYADQFHHGTVWTAGDGLFRSEDFGHTWERFTTPTSPVVSMYQRGDSDNLIVLLEEGKFGVINSFNHFFYDYSPPEELGSVLAVTSPPSTVTDYEFVVSTETGVYLRRPTGEFVPMASPVEDVVTALAFDASGTALYMGTRQSGLWVGWGEFISGVAENGEALPDRITLHPAWPNPFNASTRIAYDLPRSGRVDVSVYDLLGRRVALLEKGLRSAGRHEVSWEATGASGTFIIRLQSDGINQTQKVMLVR